MKGIFVWTNKSELLRVLIIMLQDAKLSNQTEEYMYIGNECVIFFNLHPFRE